MVSRCTFPNVSPQTRLRYEASLDSLESLVEEVKVRLAETDDPERVYEELRDLMLERRALGQEEQEDRVLEAMDLLTSWGNPRNRLVPPDRTVRR